jgi:hypothetical protein
LVARLLWEQDAAGSNPVTRTICRKRSTALKQSAFFDLCDMVYLINLKQKKLNLNFQPSFYFRVYMGESFQGDKTDET